MPDTFEGACTCRAVSYRMEDRPMFVHCCHCSWCQRETGTAFALNAIIESDRVTTLAGEPQPIDTPSNSGTGQVIWRCPTCRVALWSNYGGRGDLLRFVRVGTLLEPGRFAPDVHIFTSTRLPWVILPPDARAFPEYYDSKKEWPADSYERRAAVLARLKT
jgi:hypothetical protein